MGVGDGVPVHLHYEDGTVSERVFQWIPPAGTAIQIDGGLFYPVLAVETTVDQQAVQVVAVYLGNGIAADMFSFRDRAAWAKTAARNALWIGGYEEPGYGH